MHLNDSCHMSHFKYMSDVRLLSPKLKGVGSGSTDPGINLAMIYETLILSMQTSLCNEV